MEIGYTLLLLRMKNQMSIDELADRMHVNSSLIEKWENDELSPNNNDMEQLGKLFGVTAEQLVNGYINIKGNIHLKSSLADEEDSEDYK